MHAAGPLALLEDLGRPGRAALGVSPSGAADRAALRQANRLVGNPETAAAVETMLGGLQVSSAADLWVVVTGPQTQLWVGDAPVGSHRSVRLPAGAQLRIDPPPVGLRSYLAVRGGIAVPTVLGSRSRDVRAEIGPPPLRAGDVLPVGRPHRALPAADYAPPRPFRGPLAVLPGPRRDRFEAAALDVLLGSTWTVEADSDRTALRLAGPELRLRDRSELALRGTAPRGRPGAPRGAADGLRARPPGHRRLSRPCGLDPRCQRRRRAAAPR